MPDLFPSWRWGDLDLTSEPFLFARDADGFNPGAPVTATEALAQLLTDGEIEVSTRASNRTLEFTVYVEATDLMAAAQAEAVLVAESEKARNTLTFDPGDGYGAATVYETFRAQLTFVRDDAAEEQSLRRYDVTVKAAPWGRSLGQVETVALSMPEEGPDTPTTVTINAGDSTTGWTSTYPGVLADIGSELQVSGSRSPRATYSGTFDFTETPYVSLVMDRADSTNLTRRAAVPTPFVFLRTSPTNEVQALLVAIESIAGTTKSRYYWSVPASIATSVVSMRFGINVPTGNYTVMRFSSLQRTNTPPFSGTTRQKMRTVEVVGSARTQGSLAIEHATSSLGSVLVYTWPQPDSDYSPPLRARRISGGAPTIDTALVSGASDMLDTVLVFDIPVSALIAGAHLLTARVRSDTNGDQTINYSAQLRQNPSTPIGPSTSGSAVVPFSTTPTTWRNVVLGRMMLPPTDVPVGSTSVVRVTIVAANAATSNIDLDEAWLFNTSVGDLTWVECGVGSPAAGGPSNRLWLDTASTSNPRPVIYRGFAEDRSDAFYPGSDVQSFGIHKFSPPLMNVFTVTSNALDAAVSLEHYPRWHTSAAS